MLVTPTLPPHCRIRMAMAMVLVKDPSSKKWTPRSGLQWEDANEAARAHLWRQSKAYLEDREMPDNFSTTGLTVSKAFQCSSSTCTALHVFVA